MRNIVLKIILMLYTIGVVFYFVYYNNGLDTGIPGYLAAIQLELFGSADEKFTLYGAVAVAFAPLGVLMVVVPRRRPRTDGRATEPQPGWPESMLAAGAVVALVVLGAHFFLQHEMEASNSAVIRQVNLNEGAGKLPDDAKYVSVVGKFQDDYIYVIERVKYSRTQSAEFYVPITPTTWTPGQPIAYIAALRYGYSTRPAKDGKGLDYSIDESLGKPAKPYAAEISTSGVPIAVARGFEKEANLKLADRVYLLEQTEFPGGKPMNKYRDIEPLMPWLIPAGLPFSGILLLLGLVGLRLRRGRAQT